MKKICFILGHYFKYSKGGAELQAFFIGKELLKKYEIHYIFIKPQKFDEKKIESIEDGFFLHRLNNYNFGIFGKFLFLNYYEIYRYLNNIKPELVYQRGGRSHLGIVANWCKKKGKKLILGVSMDKNCSKKNILNLKKNLLTYPCNIINGFFTFNGIKNTDVIIAQTKHQQHLLKENFNKDSVLITNGLPVPKPPFKKADPPIISWIANIKHLKQPEIFLKLAENCKNLNIKFLYAGRPPEDSYQKKLIEKTKKLTNLKYLGEISFENTNDLLSKSSLLINTSITEGFSNTYLQAWMRETPVVTLNCDPDNIIKKNKIGLHSGNFENLVKDVKYLIKNEDIIKKMGKKAREYAIKNHNIKDIGKNYFSLFESMVNK